jgi:hypothetical protein
MTAATYRQLVIDGNDLAVLGRFWGAVLGLTEEPLGDWRRLRGPTGRHHVLLQPVIEEVTVKQRVHLDVSARSVDDVLALGATALDLESFEWKVLRDPEGGELCVFERSAQEADRLADGRRLDDVVVDSHDPPRIATWWADALGATAKHGEEWSWVEGIAGAPFRSLVFVPVPEPKTVKNRIHWDVTTSDLALLTGDGATVVRPPGEDRTWTVLADPEGNEFCAVVVEP